MADQSADTIMEEREAVMVSPTGGNPTLRNAHFIKPTLNSTEDLPPPLLSTIPTISDLKKTQLKVSFKGRPNPKMWKIWVHQLQPLYYTIWKKAGIYEAILSSTYQTLRHNNLIIGLAERWCSETNTFIFPWGEATITLEDMMVLGGYSVLGESVSNPLKKSKDVSEMEENIRLGGAKNNSHYAWMNHFMGRGGILEHQAFLCVWLSRYVFPMTSIARSIFPIAINLSKGTPVALAPAVLATIYRDLSVLKKSIIASKCVPNCLMVTLCAPFQLVQLWAWERFPTLGPNPNALKCGEPRSARWHELKILKVEDVNKAIDSAGECFLWRPYATVLNNWVFCKFYKENEEWVLVESGMDKEEQLYARCLRVSKLVGVDCIEQYLPHRVAMQFGFDQDLPCCITRSNETPEIAWSNYERPIRDGKLYIPPRLFESDVTLRYLEWWKKSILARENGIEVVARKKIEIINSVGVRLVGDCEPLMNKKDDHLLIPPGFPLKRNRVETGDCDEEDNLTIAAMLSQKSKRAAGDDEPLKPVKMSMQSEASVERPKGVMEDAEASKTKCLFVSIVHNEEKSSSCDSFEIPVIELESRISKLEKLIGRLKASKFDCV